MYKSGVFMKDGFKMFNIVLIFSCWNVYSCMTPIKSWCFDIKKHIKIITLAFGDYIDQLNLTQIKSNPYHKYIKILLVTDVGSI